jgi:REP element-mobilizing transposase RayT
MALEGYKSNHNVVYSSKYHCGWTPKYRRSVLVGPMAKRREPVMRQTAEKYRAEMIALEIMPDHVPVLVEVDPQFGIHRLVKNLKGVSSHTLRQEQSSRCSHARGVFAGTARCAARLGWRNACQVSAGCRVVKLHRKVVL